MTAMFVLAGSAYFFTLIRTRLGVHMNTLTQLTGSSVRVYFYYVLLTRLGIRVVIVKYVQVGSIIFLHVAKVIVIKV